DVDQLRTRNVLVDLRLQKGGFLSFRNRRLQGRILGLGRRGPFESPAELPEIAERAQARVARLGGGRQKRGNQEDRGDRALKPGHLNSRGLKTTLPFTFDSVPKSRKILAKSKVSWR